MTIRRLLLGLVLFSTSLCAQTTFAPIGATWWYGGMDLVQSGQLFEWVPTTNRISSLDTISIQGRVCSHLELTYGNAPCTYMAHYIAENNDSVSFYSDTDSAFHLLYVLNSIPGDSWTSTVPVTAEFSDTLIWTVTDTSSVAVGGQILRVLLVDMDMGGWMQTGIITDRFGLHSFLFPWDYGMWGGCDMGFMSDLQCYRDDVIGGWPGGAMDCTPFTGMPADASAFVTVSPTACSISEPITIDLGLARGNETILRLLNMQGQLIEVRSIHGNRYSFTLDHAGVYVVQVLMDGSPTTHQRILVQ
ncbi:MAG: hypothetical protein ABI432_19685 [Flavobacteriales bacterium]